MKRQKNRLLLLLASIFLMTLACSLHRTYAEREGGLPKGPVTLPEHPEILGLGDWYLSSFSYGGYVETDNLCSVRGEVSEFGDRIRFRISRIGNVIYLAKASNPNQYLQALDDGTLSWKESDHYPREDSSAEWVLWEHHTEYGRNLYVLRNRWNNRILICGADGTLQTLLKKDYETEKQKGTVFSALWWFGSTKEYGVRTGMAELKSFTMEGMDIHSLQQTVAPSLTVNSNVYFSSPWDFTYTVEDATLGGFTEDGAFFPERAGTTRIIATHKYTGRTAVGKVHISSNAVIVVPGIFGTDLVDQSSGEALFSSEVVMGLTGLGTFYGSLTKIDRALGDLKDTNIVPVVGNYGLAGGYRKLMNLLTENNPGDYTVDFFPYDWRRSTVDAAKALSAYIDDKGYDRVVFVGHSMGGLVVSQYMAMSKTNLERTERFISLGTPYLGATETMYIWTSDIGEITALFGAPALPGAVSSIIRDKVIEYFSKMPSVYELLPTEQAFSEEWSAIEGVTEIGRAEAIYKAYLESFDSNLWIHAKEANARLYTDGKHITEELEKMVYVVGDAKKTADSVTVTNAKLTFSFSDKGDSIVPFQSASLLSRYPTKLFRFTEDHVDLTGAFGFSDTEKKQIIEWVYR